MMSFHFRAIIIILGGAGYKSAHFRGLGSGCNSFLFGRGATEGIMLGDSNNISPCGGLVTVVPTLGGWGAGRGVGTLQPAARAASHF